MGGVRRVTRWGGARRVRGNRWEEGVRCSVVSSVSNVYPCLTSRILSHLPWGHPHSSRAHLVVVLRCPPSAEARLVEPLRGPALTRVFARRGRGQGMQPVSGAKRLSAAARLICPCCGTTVAGRVVYSWPGTDQGEDIEAQRASAASAEAGAEGPKRVAPVACGGVECQTRSAR